MPQQRLGIAPLTGGVSTQPPANRFASQTETSDNTLLALNRGLEKRFGSDFVSSPDTASGNLNYTGDSEEVLFHVVERNDDTVYFLLIDKTKDNADVIQAFSLDGTKLTINVSDSTVYDYLKTGTLGTKDGLVVKTYADTTFLLNREVTVALGSDTVTYTYQSSDPVVTTLSAPLESGDPEVQNLYQHLIQTDVGYATGYYKAINKGSKTGPWYERARTPMANSTIDDTTMPITLVYDPSDSSLTLSRPSWNPRMSGDDVTNPGPSFVGQTLSDLAIFDGRMWISGGQQIVSSQAEDIYNFWVNDWTTVVDSDPIDITLSGSSVESGRFLIPFSKTLVVIADGAKQWEIQSLESFTPSSTNLVETTTYDVDSKAVPTKIGNQLYFTSDQGQYTSVWEYFPNFDRDSNVGDEISSHIEEYVPQNVRRIAPSENNNMLFLWSEDERNVLYVYTTRWQVSEKIQSSWCRWVFDTDIEIVGHAAVNNFLYVFMTRDNDTWLEKIPITPPEPTSDGFVSDTDTYALTTEDGEDLTTEDDVILVVEEGNTTGVGYHAHMDRKVVVTGSYSSSTKMTTFTCPFEDANMDKVILGEQWGDRTGQSIAVTNNTTGGATTLTVTGDFSTYPVILGKTYTMSVKLTRPFVKDESQIVVQGNTQIRTIDFLLKDTTTFNVEVTPRGRPTKTQKFSAARYGSAVFGRSSTDEFARYRTSVRGDASDTSIVVKNDTPFPSQFTSLEYIVNFVPARNNPTKR